MTIGAKIDGRDAVIEMPVEQMLADIEARLQRKSKSALAKHLAVSQATIDRWIKSGRIPATAYFRAGPLVRFNVAAVEKALGLG